MKAIWNNTVVAEAPQDQLIRIEGNWYFPPDSIDLEFFSPTDMHTTCFWKGEANYYNVTVEGLVAGDAAWYYPEPLEAAVEKVGKDFTDYVAFWHGVEVKD